MTRVIVIDSGVVNIKNVIRGFEYVGARVESSKDPDCVYHADRVVLPGVGAFAAGMAELRSQGMDDALKEVAKAGRPILGICLGMQMLLDQSTEHGQHAGLGLISGSVLPIPNDYDEEGRPRRKVPHIGWNVVGYSTHVTSWEGTCLDSTSPGSYFYFVHSYMVNPSSATTIVAQCIYQGLPLIAAINKDNITGLQFHPERSGPVGLDILRRFQVI